jgi:hypothetical protein
MSTSRIVEVPHVISSQDKSSIPHFGLSAIEYGSVSLAKNRCMEAQAIITALSVEGG